MSREEWNACQRPPTGGHYESWFLRANHPREPRAFWIRYTIFVAADSRPSLGELWFVYFDRDAARIVARRREVPLGECRFSDARLDVRVGDARLEGQCAGGEIGDVRWSLTFEGSPEPLLLLPPALYRASFPRAKSVVPLPMAAFSGALGIGDETIAVDGWGGSQNHNWGSRHTDRYAWGQVAGFDDAPDCFLECATAKVRLGPLWSPWITLAVVRLGGETLAVNDLARGMRASAAVRVGDWSFETRRGDLRIRAHLRAALDDFAVLQYHDPPGGQKTCLNSKTAACELEVERRGAALRRFHTKGRAAFELLLDPERAPRDPHV